MKNIFWEVSLICRVSGTVFVNMLQRIVLLALTQVKFNRVQQLYTNYYGVYNAGFHLTYSNFKTRELCIDPS